MSDFVPLLKTLGDATRWKIVEFLARPIASCCSRDDGVCACDLEAYLDLAQPTVSHHMKQLVDAGIVRGERRGRWVYYELRPDALRRLAGALSDLADAGEAAAVSVPGGAAAETGPSRTGRARTADPGPR